jgi:hypothetical protein
MYSYQPEGWLDPHTVLAPDAHTHTPMHTLIQQVIINKETLTCLLKTPTKINLKINAATVP